jgi:hypothetical protein
MGSTVLAGDWQSRTVGQANRTTGKQSVLSRVITVTATIKISRELPYLIAVNDYRLCLTYASSRVIHGI